ncbi:MAG: hypothetical protein AB8B47_05950 [Roseobacter sp.]
MLDNENRLNLTADDIAMIEAALHTQKKILSVQSEAGRTGAKQKLTKLQQLIRRIGHNKPTADAPVSWTQMARDFFAPTNSCSQTRF